MKYPIFITLGTIATLAVGAVSFTPEQKEPLVITPKPEKPRRIALPAQAVQGWMNSRGVNHVSSPHVYRLMVDEAPPVVDISQVSLKDVADEYNALLDEADVDTALNGKSANDIIIEKAQYGIAGKKPLNNFVNDLIIE